MPVAKWDMMIIKYKGPVQGRIKSEMVIQNYMTPRCFPRQCNDGLAAQRLVQLDLLAFGKAVTLQNVKYASFGRLIVSLAELGKVWSDCLLNLRDRLVHCLTDICYLVSKTIEKPRRDGGIPRLSCSQTFAFMPTP